MPKAAIVPRALASGRRWTRGHRASMYRPNFEARSIGGSSDPMVGGGVGTGSWIGARGRTGEARADPKTRGGWIGGGVPEQAPATTASAARRTMCLAMSCLRLIPVAGPAMLAGAPAVTRSRPVHLENRTRWAKHGNDQR